ncbi:MAG: hypothetical protein AB7F40_00365 [Victivallaceae bacterium]|nr:hypothetical protein [Victivallaceae bacterium]
MMNRALELFEAVPRRHNCAQATACGCGREELYGELASCGGGKAEDGVCGALFAAMKIVPENVKSNVADEFVAGLGSAKCRDLKLVHRVACARCVEVGAELAEKYREA